MARYVGSDPAFPAVTDMLKNPAYAGAFVYGRTRLRSSSPSQAHPQKTMPEWRIVVKDKYPAYVSWETFEKIQATLRDNRADYLRVKGRGVPRDGAALLHGIAWCGDCGHKMVVRYKGGSQYVCHHLRQQHDVPVCQCLRAAPNRLVAAELERRWEAALTELRQAEAASQRRAAPAPCEHVGVDPHLRAKVIALGARLPAIWIDPATPREHRKALLRCLIDKVVMLRSARDKAQVRIVWRGGATTEFAVMMPVNSLTAQSRQAEMKRRICELASASIYDDEIARTLTSEGHRSSRHVDKVLPSTVRDIRLRHRIKAVWRCTRWPKIKGKLSVTELAARLRAPTKWIYTQLRRGSILTTLDPAGRYLFPDDEAAMQAIRALRVHSINRVDLREHQHQKEG
jgi:hypothetical protein